jgi:hypothetical protein
MLDKDRQVRPFGDFLAEINTGLSHTELSEAFNSLVTAVSDIGKVGTLTYVIKVSPAGHMADGMVSIVDEVKLKMPTPRRPDSIWYVTSDGNVSRDNPNQLRLPLREVPAPDRPAADPDTGEMHA